ncbi:MAG: LUD domain-containing protein [Alphaproteobacteria bacterium]|nr:LUD domain-containing protein [Alphaproteobacteria bacterium]
MNGPDTFHDNARAALADASLQARLARTLKDGFRKKRLKGMGRMPEYDALRDRARDIKADALDRLDALLVEFEANVVEAGGHVHWARDGAEARDIILTICKDAGAKTVTKGKSMITEEIGLNAHLSANGITPVETDLGEYIIQLRNEPPSHIVAPAFHLSKEQVAETFKACHDGLDADRDLSDPHALLVEARARLRATFLAADVGITGANILVAETGTALIVTNEGNGDLTQTLPPVHVAVASLEKIVPTLEDATTLLRLLPRTATGQDVTVYTTFFTGAKRGDDLDGPRDFHVVVLDHGRSELLGTEFRDILRCIRCGACINHCPIYAATGGHAYGWVYPGPMGSVLTPFFKGLEAAHPLPSACTGCGRCAEVCPVRIPVPDLLRRWRVRAFAAGMGGAAIRWGLGLWAFAARRPGLYRLATRVAARILKRMAGKPGALERLSAPQGETFFERYKRGER